MSVQTIHFQGEGGRICENHHFFCAHLTFWPDFYYFHGDVWHSKNVDVYSFFGGGRGSQKVYVLYTHENVDIYGWPLKWFEENYMQANPTKFQFIFMTSTSKKTYRLNF